MGGGGGGGGVIIFLKVRFPAEIGEGAECDVLTIGGKL